MFHIKFWAQKNKFYAIDTLDEASNSLENKMPMEQSYNSRAHKICLLGPQILVLPRAPDGLKTALFAFEAY